MGSSAGSTPTARPPRQARGGGAGEAPSTTPVFLNVYDVTPANGYARWLGLGVYHSGVQGTFPFVSSVSRARHRVLASSAASDTPWVLLVCVCSLLLVQFMAWSTRTGRTTERAAGSSRWCQGGARGTRSGSR